MTVKTRPKLIKDPDYGWGCWVVCASCKGRPSAGFGNPWGCADCRNEGRIFEPDDRRNNPPKGGLEFF